MLNDMSRTQFKRLLRNPCRKHLAASVSLAKEQDKGKEKPTLYCLVGKERERDTMDQITKPT